MKKTTLTLAAVTLFTTHGTLGCGHSQSTEAVAEAKPAVAAAAAVEKVDNSFRTKVPTPGPQPALHAPVPEKKVLANGLTVLSYHKPGLPLVSMTVVVRSGSAQDPKGVEGLAGFTGDMLKMGTDSRSASAIADEEENHGTSIDVDVDEDSITLSATALTHNIGPVTDVIADILQHAKFAPEEVERVRKQRLTSVTQANDDPRRSAAKVFRRSLYGSHPYGHTPLGDKAGITKISGKELKDFYAKHFRPANAAVVIVGDMTSKAALKEVDTRLGKWKGKPAPQAAPDAPKERPGELVLVARADAPQSQLVVGELGVNRADPDYFSLVVCNAILGGLFNSRINLNLREDKAYTYGARSTFDFMRARGPFFVATAVKTDVTDLAIREVLKEIATIRTADVTAEELGNAKSRYSLSLPGYFQTVDGIAGMMANLYLYDLPLDYFQNLPERINAVTVADVRRVAEKHLHPDKLTIVVVGDPQHVGTGLADLQRGTVQLRDAEGNTAPAAAPAKTGSPKAPSPRKG